MARRSAKEKFEAAAVDAVKQTLAIHNVGWDPDDGTPMSAEHAELLKSLNITVESEQAASSRATGLFNPFKNGQNRKNGRPEKPANSNDAVVALLREHRPEDFQGRFTLARAERTRSWLKGKGIAKGVDAVQKMVNRAKRNITKTG